MNDVFNLLSLLLERGQVKVDREELKFQLLSHPTYPSLHSIGGVLDHFDIDNLAVQVPADSETLRHLPDSFLAQIEGVRGKEMTVVEKSGDQYKLTGQNNKGIKTTRADFLEKFTGVIVAIEKPTEQIISGQQKKRHLGLNLLLALSALVFLAMLWVQKPALIHIIYSLLSVLGVVISTTILKQEQGIQSALGDAFCSAASEKKSCEAVINSDGAKVFGGIKLSGISLVYFIGLFLVSGWNLLENGSFSIAYLISPMAIPVTFYSIYYQYAVVKKWCMLCLGLVSLLWLQAVIVLLDFNAVAAFSFEPNTVMTPVLGFLLATSFWLFIGPNINLLKELKEDRIAYHRFKRNFEPFRLLLQKSTPLDTTIANAEEIVFGPVETPLSITIVTNPFCGHCKPVHTLIEQIHDRYPKEACISIRFYVALKDEQSDAVRVSSRLIEIYHTSGPTICLEAMHDIYGHMDTAEWLRKWGVCEQPETYIALLRKENEWCVKNGINFTPEILINGRSLPKEYDRKDLIYFIEELYEDCSEPLQEPAPEHH